MNVKYITMDLYDNYRDIAYHWLPNAVVCADSFHIKKILMISLINLEFLKCMTMKTIKKVMNIIY